jgi:hypothetical protein
MRRAKGKAKPNLACEIRRLQKINALLIAIQFASNHDADFEISDALAVVNALVDETLAGLDRLEVHYAQP